MNGASMLDRERMVVSEDGLKRLFCRFRNGQGESVLVQSAILGKWEPGLADVAGNCELL